MKDLTRLWLARAVANDEDLRAELLGVLPGLLPGAQPGEESSNDVQSAIESAAAADPGLEAIIARFGRPSLLCHADGFEQPAAETWRKRLDPHRDGLRAIIPSVGRLGVVNHHIPYAGTAWMIADDVAVTNRHVADLFTRRGNGSFDFASNAQGQKYGATIDFRREHDGVESHLVTIEEILYVAGRLPGEPDLAFVRVRAAGGQRLPPALQVWDDDASAEGRLIAAIGFPAWDSRNDARDMDRIFGGVYEVKRLAPGYVKSVGSLRVAHDCTTLGGSSGSAVIDLETGRVVGLHFSGRESVANYAVRAAVLRKYYRRWVGKPALVTVAASPAGPGTVGSGDVASAHASKEELGQRGGYDETFLGARFPVPLPRPVEDGVAYAIPGAPADRSSELRYHHVSVVMHKERRLALFTACNIDGGQMRRIKRRSRESWHFDPRLPEEAQLGGAFYDDTPAFGANLVTPRHLVRRLDAAWGDDADKGEQDAFYWTTSAPMHMRLLGTVWQSLEDFVLESAVTFGFRACVFAGPIFRDTDPEYRGLAKIPQAYWKVMVMVVDAEREEDQALSAIACVLSRAELVGDLDHESGPYRTYQVRLSWLQRAIDLKFADAIEKADAMAARETYRLLTRRADVAL